MKLLVCASLLASVRAFSPLPLRPLGLASRAGLAAPRASSSGSVASRRAPASGGAAARGNCVLCAEPARGEAAADVAGVTTGGVESVRTVCVALLGQLGKIEDDPKVGDVLDYDGFSELVDRLEVACDDSDKRAIFAMIDGDGSGTLNTREIKDAVRNSGAISGMYADSVKTFGLLIAATLAFDLGIFALRGPGDAFDFFTAYVVEDSLSVDNLFVFLLIFRYFRVPPGLVDKCLNWGIGGSILLRGAFIFAGLAAANAFSALNLFFSGFLLYSSYNLLAGDGDDEDEDEEPPEVVINLLAKLPITGDFTGDKFFVDGEGGGVRATQLTATLITIALSDVIFAVDSIPAVLAISDDPFVVYTSNIAAVGLRSLYQVRGPAGDSERRHALKTRPNPRPRPSRPLPAPLDRRL